MDEEADSRADRFVLQNPMRMVVVVLYGLFVLGSALSVVFGSPIQKVIGVAGVVGFGWFCFRAYKASVVCTADGVTTSSETWNRKIGWDTIASFEQRGLRGIGVRLRNGKWIPVLYYATLGDISPERATALLEQQRERFQQSQPQQP